MDQTPSFSIKSTLLDSYNKDHQAAAMPQLQVLIAQYMKADVSEIVHCTSRKIREMFISWVGKNENSTTYTNCREFVYRLEDLISSERKKSYFQRARKRKAEEAIKKHNEIETKVQKIEKTSDVEFFSDPNIFVLIMDFLPVNELLLLRTCCRFMHNALEEFGLNIVQKFKVVLDVKFCSEVQRGHCEVVPMYKKKCMIGGVAKESLNYCIMKSKALSKKKHVEFTELVTKSISHFQSSTLINLIVTSMKPKANAECKTHHLQGCTVITSFPLLSVPIKDEFSNQTFYYINQFARHDADFPHITERCNQLVQVDANNPQEKLILSFFQHDISIERLPKVLSTPLNEHLILYVFDFENLFVIQGDKIYTLNRKNSFRIMNQYAGVSLTSNKRFLDHSIHAKNYEEPVGEKQRELLQKLQQVYSLLEQYARG